MRSGNGRRPTVWFATTNRHKFLEARQILSNYGVTVSQLDTAKVEIQTKDLEEIAEYAVKILSKKYPGRLVMTEDSGLFVDGLGGFPGPFSSYTFDTIGPRGLLTLVGPRKSRSAYFQSSIAVSTGRDRPRVFTGLVRGRIARRLAGDGGFGFDPIFVPNGSNRTFAEAGDDAKNSVSHRAKALGKMARWYARRYGGVR